jgi:hypothetical protein
VQEKAIAGGLEDHLLQDINDDIEQERGEGVALPEATAALNPSAGDPVEQDRSLACLVEHFYPTSPELREPFCKENAVQGVPADGVEGFAEIQLKNSGRSCTFVTTLHDVSRVNKVFRNRASRNKTSLVRVDKVGDEVTKPKGKALGVDLEATVLKGDRSEVVRLISPFFLG